MRARESRVAIRLEIRVKVETEGRADDGRRESKKIADGLGIERICRQTVAMLKRNKEQGTTKFEERERPRTSG